VSTPYFNIMAVSGRLYTLPMLKAAWRRAFTGSALSYIGWTRQEYNREGYRVLEDALWMRARTGMVPAAVMSDAESTILRRFVLPWPTDGFEAFLRGGDSFTLGRPVAATIAGDRASDYERQIVSSVDGGPLEVWRGRTGFFVCPEDLVHQLPSGLNMIQGVEWTRVDPQPYWVTGNVARALTEARSLVEARGPDGAWLKFRPADEGRTDPAVALAQLAQANATFAAVLLGMAGVKPAQKPSEPVDGAKGLPAGFRKLLED
jgi:hypothetical protein